MINLQLMNQLFEIELSQERERCAKIVEAMRPTGGRMWTAEQHATFEALSVAAENIRNPHILIDPEGRVQINESS